jgi:hypothetical protein
MMRRIHSQDEKVVHPREGSLRRPILVPLPHLSKCIELVFKSCAIENLIVPVFTMRARVIMPLSPPTARQDSRRTSTSNPPRPGISHEGTRKGGERTRRGGEGDGVWAAALPLRAVPSDDVCLFEQAVNDLGQRKAVSAPDGASSITRVSSRRTQVPIAVAHHRLA